MAFVIADRVRETTTTTGTGSVTLGGAYTSFQTFSAAIGNANNTYYTIASATSGEWEVGIGTYSSSGNLLSRDTVLSSSNGGSLVSFTSGTKDVFVTQPASRAIFVQNAGTGLQTGTTAFTASRVLYANATSTTTTSSNLTFDGTTLVAANFTDSSLTSGRVTYATTGGNLTDSANLLFDGTTLTANALTTTSTVTINGGTANGVAYLNGSKVLTTGSALTFDGTNFTGPRLVASSTDATGSVIQVDTSATAYGQMGGSNSMGWKAGSQHIWNITAGEQMRLTSTGLGIGTSSPGAKLDIGGTNNTVFFKNSGATTGYALATVSNTGAVFQYGVSSSTGTFWGSGNAGNYSVNIGTTSAVNFGFGTSDTLRMLLDSSGNLGIGTSSPQALLDIYSSGNTTLRISGSSGGGGDVSQIDFFRIGSNVTSSLKAIRDGANTSGALAFYTAAAGTNTEKMRLDSSGNLGIGTSSPSQKLHVRQDQAAYTWGRFDNQSSSASAYAGIQVGAFGNTWGIAIGSSAANNNALTFVLDAGGSNSEKMRLDSSGNLGLGVTPSAWSSLAGGAFQNGGNGALWSQGTDEFWVTQNVYFNGLSRYTQTRAATAYQQSNGQHRWWIAPSGTAGNAITFTQAMTLDASGNLLVGVTSASGNRMYVRTASTSGNAFYSDNTADTSFKVQFASGLTSIGNDFNAPLAFLTNNTERARITSGGDLLVGGQTSATTIGGRGSKINAQQAAATAEWAGAFIHPATTGTNAFGVGIRYSASAPNSAQNPFLYMEDNAALRAEIRSNGGLANYSGNNVNLSDRREKTNFAPAKSYLETICAIPVQTFNYIDQSEDDPGLTLGVVAQDVQAVAPELVMESNWGTEDNPKMRLSIYQTDLQYALMKALQELKAEFDAYKATHP